MRTPRKPTPLAMAAALLIVLGLVLVSTAVNLAPAA